MVDRAHAISTAGVRARLLEHAVAIGHEVYGIGITPNDAALLQRIEPVIENLGVGPHGVSGMCALNRMLVSVRKSAYGQLRGRGISSEA
jgi:hypothetical protein